MVPITVPNACMLDSLTATMNPMNALSTGSGGSNSVSKAVGRLVASDIRDMTRYAVAQGAINLGQGLCDVPTPPQVIAAAQKALRDGHNSYSFAEGEAVLREALANKLRRHNKMTVNPQSEIVVTLGATGAFNATVQALLDPGDEVILFSPYYGYHKNCLALAGLVPVVVPLLLPSLLIDAQAIQSKITSKTRAIVVCTPANPCGKMYSQDELRILSTIAEANDLIVITDEIYEYIRYDSNAHISPATVGTLGQRTVSIMGMSKTFSVTGWRLGYVVAPLTWAKAIRTVSDLLYVCAPTPLQWGAAAGVGLADDFYRSLSTMYQKKRDLLCTTLSDIGLQPIVPQGAYYVLAQAKSLRCDNSWDAAQVVLNKAGVACIPGRSFFDNEPEPLLRFCFAKEDALLEKACHQLRQADF